ncbi:MAG: lysine 2,3-aminomutase [Polyangiaceae bacterium]|nr:lysine 2,3-aminomutase [Polyangiaceae bacterium]
MTFTAQRPSKFRVFQRRDIDSLPRLAALPASERQMMKVVSAVLPFRVNNYVVEELIDWSRVPDDPMYRLTFPHRDMLDAADYQTMERLVTGGAPEAAIEAAAREIQRRLNPHPAGQVEYNVPTLDGLPVAGIQHKYRETVLFFPTQGQTCHSYCTYCFRWPQFVGLDDLKFASKEVDDLVRYVRANPDVTSILITGGDPLVMRTTVLRRYIEPLLDVPQIASIRLGTKALAYWPQRFVEDTDADDLLRLFEQVVKAGKNLAFMAHYSHPVELSTPMAEKAIERVLATGATIRCQAPLIRHVNDNAEVWETMWRKEVRLGAIPYYMFVERDTGARHYFEVPLVQAYDIFRDAYSRVSGLARTVRGPSMSAMPGKVVVDGVPEIFGQKVIALRFLQARDPSWVGKPFFARFDPQATWFDKLRPAFGENAFFYEAGMERLKQMKKPLSTTKPRLPMIGDTTTA